MDMDERKIKILQAIINDYINTGEPVGSRTIAKKYDLGISSATIRNEMSDLEEMGFLEHIHTSSGRKPSDKGYRLYVDRLMQIHELSTEEQMLIKLNIIDNALFEVDKIVKKASSLLSELTKLTCIVKVPSVKKSFIKTIQLINLDATSILSVIVTDNGMIKNNLLRVSKPIDSDILLRLNNILNERLKNLTIEAINLEVINNLKQDLFGYDDIFNAIIPVLYETLNFADSSEIYMEGETNILNYQEYNDIDRVKEFLSLNFADSSEIYMEGETNILNYQEYNDIDRVKEFLSLVNNEDNVKSLLSNTSDISISIGGENFIEGAKDCSIISKVYTIGDRPVGTIGLIGPTRMQYSKVISILTKVIKELNDNLSHSYDDW
jgi:heat shock gene repressor HrcA